MEHLPVLADALRSDRLVKSPQTEPSLVQGRALSDDASRTCQCITAGIESLAAHADDPEFHDRAMQRYVDLRLGVDRVVEGARMVDIAFHADHVDGEDRRSPALVIATDIGIIVCWTSTRRWGRRSHAKVLSRAALRIDAHPDDPGVILLQADGCREVLLIDRDPGLQLAITLLLTA